jgi:carbonic anhydrase
VRAAYTGASFGLIDNWVRHVQDVRDRHGDVMAATADVDAAVDRLCELNVIEQVRGVCQPTIVQDAWRRDQPLFVHGLIYNLCDGLLRDLDCTAGNAADVGGAHMRAVAAVKTGPRPAAG